MYHYNNKNLTHFTTYFGRLLLQNSLPPDVDVLKVDIPCDASLQPPWEITRLSRTAYFEATQPERTSWEAPARIGYRQAVSLHEDTPDTDAYALRVRRIISVTPISLDLTSRVDLPSFEKQLRQEA